MNVSHFLALVKNIWKCRKLRQKSSENVEKVYVYHHEKINRQKTQCVRIVWNCIGEIPTQLKNKTA